MVMTAIYMAHILVEAREPQLRLHVSEYELMLSGHWRTPKSLGSYVAVPEERRYEISKILYQSQYSLRCFEVSSCSSRPS